MLSPLFFSNPFLSLDFLLLLCVQCFNLLVPSMVISLHGRSGKWRPWIKVRSHVHSFPPSPRSVFFLTASIFPSFWTMLSPLFPTHFYHWTFLCWCVVQCLTMLMHSMVISPPGRSGKWLAWMEVRTLFPPSPKSGIVLWLFLFSFFLILLPYSALALILFSIFEQCSLLIFFNPFLSLNCSLLLSCSVCLCCCLQWWSLQMAGRKSDEHATQYVHSSSHLFQDRVFF